MSAFVTTRAGGVSQAAFDSFNLADHVGDTAAAVASNRQRLRDTFPGIHGWQWLRQVHGARVVVLQGETTPVEADAVITREAGLALSILTADCLPLLLTAEDGSEIAAVHCGWRGLASGIVGNTIQAMQTPSELILAWMGPAIGPCHFEVGREVYGALSAILSEDAKASRQRLGKFMATVWVATPCCVTGFPGGGGLCTSCDGDGSFRVSPICGRIATTICMRSA